MEIGQLCSETATEFPSLMTGEGIKTGVMCWALLVTQPRAKKNVCAYHYAPLPGIERSRILDEGKSNVFLQFGAVGLWECKQCKMLLVSPCEPLISFDLV